jgi:hypothetical protein
MSRIAIPQRSAVLARGEVLFFWLEARDASRRNPHPERALNRPSYRATLVTIAGAYGSVEPCRPMRNGGP